MESKVTFGSSNKTLEEGFRWAKDQALAYVFEGDPVGDWYEAALPGREAFCMRDVAHQSTGAQVLGLSRFNYNMLHKFAVYIAESRDWCSFWEINRHDLPAPVDYTSDADFWYNLPANFDVLECCYRQYQWTGDRRYLDEPAFRNFYARTVTDYVHRWDKDGDGIPEHYAPYGRRGIASYNEDVARPLVGGDLIAAQFGAFHAYASMLTLLGETAQAAEWREQARHLSVLYDQKWWNEKSGRFACLIRHDGRFATSYQGITNFFPLVFGLVQDPRKAQAVLAEVIARRRKHHIEERSYLPELFYLYGEASAAYAELVEQLQPKYVRREYPEVSYAVIGAIAAGMMGIAPNAVTRTVATRSRLDERTAWAALASVPVFDNLIDVRHEGRYATEFVNQAGSPLVWQAEFVGHAPTLLVDGQPCQPTWGEDGYGQAVSWVAVPVGSASTQRVSVA